jgi:hypothetical protein
MAQTVFSYDVRLSTDRDWVRYYIGDTHPDRAEVDDQELDALLAEEPEPEPAVEGEEPTPAQWRSYRKTVAAQAAEAIAAKYAREADVTFDNQRVAMSAKFAQYTKLATRLRSESQSAVPLKVVRW